MTFHEEKFEHLIKELAMEFIAREANRTALITMTGLRVMDRGAFVTIMFTVLPETKEKAALDFMKRKRRDFRDFVMEKARLRAIPTFDFEIDIGEKNRQKIDAHLQSE